MVLLLLVACLPMASEGPASLVQPPGDYETVKAQNPTKLTRRGPSSQPYDDTDSVEGVTEVSYPAPGGALRGWTAGRSEGLRQPAIVYFHGGFATGPSEMAECIPFLRAGYRVFIPALRGENGNPGDQEYYWGEVDDAAAAVRWMAAQPDIDPSRVYTFGHSAGGVISGFMSLLADLPVAATGSAGGVYPEQAFTFFKQPYPFDTRVPLERELRGWVHWLGSMKRPHHAFVGKEDWLHQWVEPLRTAAKTTKAPLTVTVVPGDHFESLEPAVEAFTREISGAPDRAGQ